MQNKYKLTTILTSALLALTMTFSAAASVITLTADINGAQANAGAGTGSMGTGTAMMWLDDETNDFSWDISWSGLSGPATAAHFHGPALPTANAGVAIALMFSMGESMGSAMLSDDEASDVLSGLWYINVHTEEVPAGEIRGQVMPAMVPAPSIAFLGLLAISALGFRQSKIAKK